MSTRSFENLIPPNQMTKFYAFYGITPHHPLSFQFRHSNLAGSYFLGKCRVTNSLLYKSDIRGDELKKKGDLFQYQEFEIPVNQDEEIEIEDSFLIKTLVHYNSHDPETLERFFVRDTIATHYANIHGSPTDGCFLGPFSTVDLTTMRDCVIGAFSYIQAGEISHLNIEPGTVWVRSPENFNFLYRYPADQLSNYIYFAAGSPPQGVFIDFVEDRKEAFQRVFNVVNIESSVSVPQQRLPGSFCGHQAQDPYRRKCAGRPAGLSAEFMARQGGQCPGALLHHQLPPGRQQRHRPRRQDHRSGSGDKCVRRV